ncbi:hypothetical protein CKAH01_13128 [Colletotrichum kahawae]|uniref:non-specific serine/threonine protein kinase n=1 Tax=Colletotrichum kahawae TaxID=34407 RepID=A0AAD9YRT5_COLKA|nr:hypothetical protein CKAH01_13128 [Colletotrichum kahawae]
MLPNSRPSTPPHNPNYGARMSPESIRSIMHQTLQGLERVDIDPLPSLRSFNNRIYFLKGFCCQFNTQQDDAVLECQDYVLKINGRGFGADKIQNEVSCLRLLETYCPRIPVPRAVAWSQDGSTAEVISKDRAVTKSLNLKTTDGTLGGWILMTRVSGEPVDLLNISSDTKASLATQLADVVATWRQSLPPQIHVGNLRFLEGDCKNSRPDITLPGLSGSTTDKLVIRDLVSPIRNFIQHTLPSMAALHRGPDVFVFTHYDLSPRNVLVSGTPPQITGIVDFEFSGFFPPLDEFLNDNVGNNGDWPKDMYEVYLKQLEDDAVPTPLKSISQGHWEQALFLEKLLESIAPWWLLDHCRGEESNQELNKARAQVLEYLERLPFRR